MAVDRSQIGKVCGRQVVAIDRAPVAMFAESLRDRSPLYRDRRAARDAGFADIPVPPTFPFSAAYWGSYPELQERLEPISDNPLWTVMGGLGPGLIMHAEQEFDYERPVVVGDVLRGEDVLADVYEKETDTHVMTFVVTETRWTDDTTGELVLTTRSNLVHRARRPAPA